MFYLQSRFNANFVTRFLVIQNNSDNSLVQKEVLIFQTIDSLLKGLSKLKKYPSFIPNRIVEYEANKKRNLGYSSRKN